jgi:hypothetical protein
MLMKFGDVCKGIFAGAFTLLLFLTPGKTFAQQLRTITGKVSDAQTGEPIPYATIFVKLHNHTNKAISTNFDGHYIIEVPAYADTIFASYISYLPSKKAILNTTKEINFQLLDDTKLLKEVKVTPKSYVNPAWEIMEQMVKHKEINNLEKLYSYEFESYSRIAVSLNNLSDKMKRRKAMKQLLPLMDSLKDIAGSDGTPILPIFMSETISDVYHRLHPDQKTENVLRTKVNGVGIEDATLISQIVSSGFQQYNFYNNYLRIAGKDFISPMTNAWKGFYDYELIERNELINGKYYFKIAFKPKLEHDLAFAGVMWLTQDSYALYRMDATLSAKANIDFLNKIKVKQEMTQPPGTDVWIPALTRVLVYVDNPIKGKSGFIGQFYISNRNILINKTYPDKLFKESLTLSDDADKKDDNYWVTHRHDTLTKDDKRIYQMIDTVKSLPIVRTYADIIGMLINGYYRVGDFSFGPYLYTYSYNDLQGSVLRLGGQTNRYFSNRLILGGSVSYGFKDQQWIFDSSVDYIFKRKPWTQAGVSYVHDISQTTYQFENFNDNNTIFNTSIRNGDITNRGPFLQNQIKFYYQTDLTSQIRGKVSFLHRTFDPLTKFNYTDPISKSKYHDYEVSEIGAEIQWTPGRRQLQSSKINKRISVGNGEDNAILTVRYTKGLKTVYGVFNYDKFSANLTQKLHMGVFGRGEYAITAGYIPATLPLPLLENSRYSFNTMGFLEYVSDKYLQLNYSQHLDGFLTNRIPLIKALNIRTLFDFNILYAGLSGANNTPLVKGVRKFDRSLADVPYMEAGYGVENILKFLRFDFLYRLNHTDHLDQTGKLPTKFAFRTSIRFRF